MINYTTQGFPDSSVDKESTCSAGDLGSIPALGRSAAEGIGYSLLHSWASLVARLVKNQPAMRETWVWSLGWEDPLEKGKATHSSILAWRIPWTVLSMGSQRVGHFWETFTFTCESWNYKTLRKKNNRSKSLCLLVKHWFLPMTSQVTGKQR